MSTLATQHSRTLAIIGPPGAGKSTAARVISDVLAPCTSFAVRLYYEAQVRARSELGLKIEDALRGGERMIPDALVIELLRQFLRDMPMRSSLLLEGLPINREQARGMLEVLGEANRKLDHVIQLDAPSHVLEGRVLQRVVCTRCERRDSSGAPVPLTATCCPRCGSSELLRRSDDTPQQFADRLARYREQEVQILSHLRCGKHTVLDTSRVAAREFGSAVVAAVFSA